VFEFMLQFTFYFPDEQRGMAQYGPVNKRNSRIVVLACNGKL
jgi:hypothetical protein